MTENVLSPSALLLRRAAAASFSAPLAAIAAEHPNLVSVFTRSAAARDAVTALTMVEAIWRRPAVVPCVQAGYLRHKSRMPTTAYAVACGIYHGQGRIEPATHGS